MVWQPAERIKLRGEVLLLVCALWALWGQLGSAACTGRTGSLEF